jgi:hypothetical protein
MKIALIIAAAIVSIWMLATVLYACAGDWLRKDVRPNPLENEHDSNPRYL